MKMNKAVFASAILALAPCLMAATYTWTGGGDVSNWSDSSNWDPVGVPNGGDTANFNISSDLTFSSDIDISSGYLTICHTGAVISITGAITGQGGIRLTGNNFLALHGDNTFSGGVRRDSYLSAVRLYSNNGLGTGTFYACEGAENKTGLTGRTPLELRGSEEMNVPNDMEFGHESFVSWNGSIYAYQSATLSGKITFNGQTRVAVSNPASYIRFYGEVVANDLFVMNSSLDYYFESPVTGGGTMYTDSSNRPRIHMLAPGSVMHTRATGNANPTYYFEVANALDSTSLIRFNSPNGTIDLCGNDQTVREVYDEKLLGSAHCVTSAAPATLTMESRTSRIFGGRFLGELSLVYSPDSASRVYSVSNSLSTMTGSISVEKGTFQVRAGSSFPNLAGISLASGAKFKILDSDCSFNSAGMDISVADATSQITIPEGTRLIASTLAVGGTQAEYGLYAATGSTLEGVTQVDWISGGGTISFAAPATTVVWTGAGSDTLVTNPDNWDGLTQAPDLFSGACSAVFPASAQSYTATFPAGISRLRGITVSATNFTFASEADSSVMGVGVDGITYTLIDGAARQITYNVAVAPLDGQTWAADDSETASLVVTMNRPLVDDLLGPGSVVITGGGTYHLYTTNSTFTGDAKIDKPLSLGTVTAYGYEPFGPSGTLRVVAKDGKSYILLLKDVTTAKTILLDCASSRRRTLAYSGTTVFKGLVACNIEGNSDGGSTVDINPPAGTVIYEGGYGDSTYKNIYVNWGLGGTVIITNTPSYMGTVQASWSDVHFYAPSNYIKQINGWNANYSPVGMYANIHFHTNFAFYNDSARCAITRDSVWDFHGTEQTIGSLNGYGAGLSTSVYNGMISTNGPGVLNVKQTARWDSLAKSATGLMDFRFDASFMGEMSLNLTGNKRLIMGRDSTATGCVSVADSAILCFTNDVSWASATNVTVSGSGTLEAYSGNVLSKETDLVLSDSGTYQFCGEGPHLQKVHFLWLDGERKTQGDFTASNSNGHIAGNGVIRVFGDGLGTLLIFR